MVSRNSATSSGSIASLMIVYPSSSTRLACKVIAASSSTDAMIAAMHVLDNPGWHALTGPNADLAEGGDKALRYVPDVAPFAALPDAPDAEAWTALADLVGSGNVAVLFR